VAEADGLSPLTLDPKTRFWRQSMPLAGVDADCHRLMSQMANAR